MPKIFLLIITSVIVISACKSNSKKQNIPSISATDEKTLIQTEISHWEYAKLKNLGTLRIGLADDYMGFFGTNILTADGTINVFKNSDVRSYHLSNIKVKPVTDNVAIVYYTLDRDIVDANETPWAEKVAASDTYVKKGNAWKSVFYQETRVE